MHGTVFHVEHGTAKENHFDVTALGENALGECKFPFAVYQFQGGRGNVVQRVNSTFDD